MANTSPPFKMSLFTGAGERKYLTSAERKQFCNALHVLDDPKARTYVKMLYWSGCRCSEPLTMTAQNIEPDEGMVVIRSLKKRGRLKGRHFRIVPLPQHYLEELDAVHGIRRARAQVDGGASLHLWDFSRTTAWRFTKTVMHAAGLSGAKSSCKGLRHAFGIHGVMNEVPESRLKVWLGHESLESTQIYLQTAAPEDRSIAERMW